MYSQFRECRAVGSHQSSVRPIRICLEKSKDLPNFFSVSTRRKSESPGCDAQIIPRSKAFNSICGIIRPDSAEDDLFQSMSANEAIILSRPGL